MVRASSGAHIRGADSPQYVCIIIFASVIRRIFVEILVRFYFIEYLTLFLFSLLPKPLDENGKAKTMTHDSVHEVTHQPLSPLTPNDEGGYRVCMCTREKNEQECVKEHGTIHADFWAPHKNTGNAVKNVCCTNSYEIGIWRQYLR